MSGAVGQRGIWHDDSTDSNRPRLSGHHHRALSGDVRDCGQKGGSAMMIDSDAGLSYEFQGGYGGIGGVESPPSPLVCVSLRETLRRE